MVLTVLNEVVLRQNLDRAGTGQPLAEQQSDHVRKLFTLRLWPPVSVLEKAGERRILEGLLKVLVPEELLLGEQPTNEAS